MRAVCRILAGVVPCRLRPVAVLVGAESRGGPPFDLGKNDVARLCSPNQALGGELFGVEFHLQLGDLAERSARVDSGRRLKPSARVPGEGQN